MKGGERWALFRTHLFLSRLVHFFFAFHLSFPSSGISRGGARQFPPPAPPTPILQKKDRRGEHFVGFKTFSFGDPVVPLPPSLPTYNGVRIRQWLPYLISLSHEDILTTQISGRDCCYSLTQLFYHHQALL